ncbi:hypothetical protein FZW96_11210 [Bacillus sp. BGMRC 2118]|nr:hypothetical protein FZW96_11210 [Bacillus sp. BGMRC 2118]
MNNYLKKDSVDPTVELSNTFNDYISSIDSLNEEYFLTFQNSLNVRFYKEQERWFRELKFRLKDEYSFKCSIDYINLHSENSGLMSFIMGIYDSSGKHKSLRVVYSIKKNKENRWVIDDLPFEIKKTGLYVIKYLPYNKDSALYVHSFINEVTLIYMNIFNWEPKSNDIKIYSNLDEISISIPTFSVYGWSEMDESIKIYIPETSEYKYETLFQIIVHELCHMMLSDKTNGNASLYIQEGLAVYFENYFVHKDKKIITSSEQVERYLKDLLKKTDDKFYDINQLNNLSYNDGRAIYNHGFLLVYFLIKKFGVIKFNEFIDLLRTFEYIDRRVRYKLEEVNERTTTSLEEVYGDQKLILKEMQKFYLKYY